MGTRWGLLTITACIASAAYAQDVLQDHLKHSREHLPEISFTELEQCVPVGSPASAATVEFGSPSTAKPSKGWFSKGTSFSWPDPGVFRSSTFAISKNRWIHHDNRFEPIVSVFNGTEFFEISGTSPRRIYFRERAFDYPMIMQRFSLTYPISGDPAPIQERTDPNWGHIVTYEAHGGKFDLAIDRDWMVIRESLGEIQIEVQKMEKVDGHWIPTLVKRSNRYGTPNDVYTTIQNLTPTKIPSSEFTVKYKKGDFVAKNNVYYDVDASGTLVKSAMQPDRRMEYVSWAAMGVTTLVIIGIIVVGITRIFRKQ